MTAGARKNRHRNLTRRLFDAVWQQQYAETLSAADNDALKAAAYPMVAAMMHVRAPVPGLSPEASDRRLAALCLEDVVAMLLHPRAAEHVAAFWRHHRPARGRRPDDARRSAIFYLRERLVDALDEHRRADGYTAGTVDAVEAAWNHSVLSATVRVGAMTAPRFPRTQCAALLKRDTSPAAIGIELSALASASMPPSRKSTWTNNSPRSARRSVDEPLRNGARFAPALARAGNFPDIPLLGART